MRIIVAFLLCLIWLPSYAQDSTKSQITMLSINLAYGIDFPGADLADRFGRSLSFTSGFEYLSNSKMSFGIDYTYIFGSKVREDVLLPFRNEEGNVIGIDGIASDIFLRQRGAYLGVNIGRFFARSSASNGLKINLGFGYFYHKIRILDDSRSVIIAEDPYVKGLDRLTRGPALKQEILFQHHSSDQAYHFNIGFNITESFTSQVRKTNLDTGLAGQKKRIDLLYGFKVMWMVPLFKNDANKSIKYY